MNTKHTPYPWKQGARYGNLQTEVVNADGSKAIATVWTHVPDERVRSGQRSETPDAEGIANLALVIAVPELLRACEVALHVLTTDYPALAAARNCNAEYLERVDRQTARDTLREALATAKGEAAP